MARVMFAKGRLSWACEREVLVFKITASLEDSKSQGSFFSVFLLFTPSPAGTLVPATAFPPGDCHGFLSSPSIHILAPL